MVEALGGEEGIDRLVVDDRAGDEPRPLIDVLGEAAAEVIERDHLVPAVEQRAHDVGAEKARPTGHQALRHCGARW